MNVDLRQALDAALPAPVVGAQAVSGGSINEVFELELTDGTRAFAKTHGEAPPDFFATEAAGLEWLAEPGVVDVPHVLGWSDDSPAFLATEWVEPGSHTDATDEQLGRGLAALHAAGAPEWGWDREGYIGSVPQTNEPTDDWATFYGRRRLVPMARRAVDAGRLPAEAVRDVGRLADRLTELIPAEADTAAPARLHGDLWGGNLVVGHDGSPWLIDPAPYGGDPEVDLAMMRLFGGFGPAAFSAYEEVAPLPEGQADRVALYQLYPLLVHVVLFGGSYIDRTLAAVAKYL